MGAEGLGAASASAGPRQYDSTLRQRQAKETRQRIVEAATVLFGERGWSVGVRDIARLAGVSVETVYANFGSKPELLNHVLDVGVVGDDQPVALMDRPEFAALAQGSSRQRAAAAAALVTAINARTIGLQRALREASALEPALAARLDDMRSRQRLNAHMGGAMIAGHDLSPGEGDGLWAVLSMEVYELLTGSAGWSPAQYEQWVTAVIVKLLALDKPNQ